MNDSQMMKTVCIDWLFIGLITIMIAWLTKDILHESIEFCGLVSAFVGFVVGITSWEFQYNKDRKNQNMSD